MLGVQAQEFGQISQEVLESLTERGLGRDVLGIISDTAFNAGQELPCATELAFLQQITWSRHLLGDPIQQFGLSVWRNGLASASRGKNTLLRYPALDR